MNQQQRVYAIGRINEALAEKLAASKAKHTVPAVSLTGTERASLLRAGKVALLPSVKNIDRYTNAVDVFDFGAHETPAKVDEKAIQKDSARFCAAAKRAQDEVMLGDTETALRLIREFAESE